MEKYSDVIIRKLTLDDLDSLLEYLGNLSESSRKRFGPHAFDQSTLWNIFSDQTHNIGFIAVEVSSQKIIAYAIIRLGFLDHDSDRLQSYGLLLDRETDCTFAPSVADEWQGRGIGKRMFGYILEEMKTNGIRRIILWGGVQSNNALAVNYYKRLGFQTLGQFEYSGWNYDMVFSIES